MQKTLVQNSTVKQNLIDKISVFIKEYAKYKNISKYVFTVQYRDTAFIEYNVKQLNKVELFIHTAYYKKYKNVHNMIESDGNRGNMFRTEMEKWFNKKHVIYVKLELMIQKFFQNPYFAEDDLISINKLYKEFKNERDSKNSIF